MCQVESVRINVGWTNGAGGLLTAAHGLSAGINAPHVGDDQCGFKHFECANLAERGCAGKWWEAVKSFLGCIWVLLGAFQHVSEGRRVSRDLMRENRH